MFNKATWILGQLPAMTAATLNRIEQGIADAHAGARKVPSCRLTKSGAGWSVPDSGGFSDLAGGWDIETWDNDNMHDAAVNPDRITFRTAGIYLCILSLNIEGGTGERFCRISGTLAALGSSALEIDRAQGPGFVGDIVTLKIITPVVVAAGDWIYAQAGSYQKGSGCSVGTNVTAGNYGEPMFSALKIGDMA